MAVSADNAGGAIGAGGVAAANSGGSEQATKFIIGFCVAIPCTLIIVGIWWFLHLRKRAKRREAGLEEGTHVSRWGQRREKSSKKKKGKTSALWRMSDRLRPAELPAAYNHDKQLLPKGPP